MLICHCCIVTDKDIRKALSKGKRTLPMVEKETKAGTCCGICKAAIIEIIEEEEKAL